MERSQAKTCGRRRRIYLGSKGGVSEASINGSSKNFHSVVEIKFEIDVELLPK